ncbi:hypothetical protein [Cryptosporangium aurantiacum]|uniref:hypothetical protein n=1 Tax=Cryptosporangium aurantiacum TaxID=134849 RepID=UPI000933BFD0|nr:hypothetical protein [Cryptosporangium aurantiacum]
MSEGAAAAVDVLDGELIDLQGLDLDQVRALVDHAALPLDSVLGRSIQRIWEEAQTVGDTAAGFTSSL